MGRLLWRRFWPVLAAVIIGNGLYFSVQRLLPPAGRHRPFRVDLGLALDFWLCIILLNVLLLAFRSKH